MNKLLADYEAARTAIFDHCGVPDIRRNLRIATEFGSWIIDKTRTLVILDTEKGNGYWFWRRKVETDSSMYGQSVHKGDSVTLCLIDWGDDYPDYEWLALDNAMEVKP